MREHHVDQGAWVGAYRRQLYEYDDPRADLCGRGFLGFGAQRIRDPDRPAETHLTFDHQTQVDGIYPYAGLLATVTHIVPILEQQFGGPSPPPAAPRARVTWTQHQHELRRLHQDRTYFVPETRWTIDEWEEDVQLTADSIQLLQSPNVQPLRRRIGSATHDDFNNLLFLREQTTGGVRREVRTFYDNQLGPWLIGLPWRSEARSWDPDDLVPSPRVVEYQHDGQGHLHRVLVEPGNPDPDLRRTTTFHRNGDGLLTTITDETPGEPLRRVQVKYDPLEDAFPTLLWNDLGHAIWLKHHQAFGAPGRIVDLHGAQAERRIDGFGRLRESIADGGPTETLSYEPIYDFQIGIHGLLMHVEGDDGSERRVTLDPLGRAVEESARGFDGQWVHRSVRYDAFGRVVQQTRPGYGAPGAATLIRHDTLDRPLEILAPDGARTRYEHTFFETRRWDPRNNERRLTRDLDGRIIESTELLGAQPVTTQFRYGPFDLVEEIEDPYHNVTALAHDLLGRRISLDDPDRGLTEYAYNGFGELRQETDALGQTVTWQRDLLGRMLFRHDIEGTTQYIWDQGPNAAGELTKTISPDGTTTEHSYDPLGRPEATVWTVAGQSYEIRTSYDPLGRLEAIRYPEVPGEPRFTADYVYNAWGDLEVVRDVSTSTPRELWRAEARSPDGALTEAELGNGVRLVRAMDPLTGRLAAIQALAPGGSSALYSLEYGYDLSGNVDRRTDAVTGREESFFHDSLDRLSSWNLTTTTAQHTTNYWYDDLGNLTDVIYDNFPINNNVYGQNGKPHALTASLGSSYDYDARGRMWSGAGRVIAYTSFDLPRTITQGSSVTTFLYDASGARVQKSGPTGEVITLAGLYERRNQGGAPTHVFYVHADGAPVAQVVVEEGSGPSLTRWLHTDALGSIGVVTDELGGEVERVYFDPFGRRIQEDGAVIVGPTSSEVELGFTGHRHDDELGLIDMRGRVYDPALRRFLTPDPLVGDPLFSQSYNRYSYALNNPLRFVDPTGYDPLPIFGKVPDIPSGARHIPGAGVLGLKATFDLSKSAIDKSKGGGSGGATPKPARSDGGGHQPATGAVAPPSTSPGATPGSTVDGPGDSGGGGAPRWLDLPERQEAVGFVVGFGLGAVPGGAVVDQFLDAGGVLAEGTPEARRGKAMGEILAGAAQIVLGMGGEIGGMALNATGVGALAGVPVAVVSAGLLVNGAGSVAAGIRGLSQALTTGGSAGGGGPGINVASRPLTQEDLGLEGTTAIVEGSFKIKNGKAIIKIDYLARGSGKIPPTRAVRIFGKLRDMARDAGATTIRIETSPIVEQTKRLNKVLDGMKFGRRANGTRFWEGSL